MNDIPASFLCADDGYKIPMRQTFKDGSSAN